MTSSSGVESDTETDKTFSDTEQIQENQIDSSRPKDTSPTSESPKEEYEVECIEGTHIFGSQPCKRLYKVRFKGWPDPEWQPEDNLDNSLELVRCFWENKHKGLRECIEAQRVLLEELDSKSNDQSSDPENEKLQLSIPQPQQSSSSKAVPLKRKSRNRARRSKLPVKGPVDSDLASSSSDSSDSSEAEFNQHNPLPEAITSTLERFCGAAKTADFGECLMFDMSYEPEDPECRGINSDDNTATVVRFNPTVSVLS
ncbi:hypothetical protein BY996DRAFT_6415905 [Phakopsora pachyrhizi]|nr:hypothetical protein BY996DRAFT_6415905 [Phakopsora pachyrhizi]